MEQMEQKINYQRQTDQVLAALQAAGEKPRLLLHSCCGPCSTYVLEYLCAHFCVDVLFYNPNIQPREEYEKRLYWQKQVICGLGLENAVQLLPAPYRGEDFLRAARGLEQEPEHGARCTACFSLRLRETALQAAAGGYAWFATTLTVSPHKDPRPLNQLGQALEQTFGVRWLPSDFKKKGGYQRSTVLSRELGIYRQSFCGCAFARRKEADPAPGAGV